MPRNGLELDCEVWQSGDVPIQRGKYPLVGLAEPPDGHSARARHRNDPRVQIYPHADAIADMVRAPSPSPAPIAAGDETRPARRDSHLRTRVQI